MKGRASVLIVAAGVWLLACAKDTPRVTREPHTATLERATLDDGTRERAPTCQTCTLNMRCNVLVSGHEPCCPTLEAGDEDDARRCVEHLPEWVRGKIRRICWGPFDPEATSCPDGSDCECIDHP